MSACCRICSLTGLQKLDTTQIAHVIPYRLRGETVVEWLVLGRTPMAVCGPKEAARRIGARIKELRGARQIKQYELATQAQVPQPNLSRYERGEQCPRQDAIRRISKVLGVLPGDLWGGA